MRTFPIKFFLLIFVLSALAYGGQSENVFEYKSKNKRDPFLSLVTKDGRILPGARPVSETGNIVLEGIIWDTQGKSVAIINGKLLRERDRISGVQILKIKKSSVIMQREGKVLVIELKKGGAK